MFAWDLEDEAVSALVRFDEPFVAGRASVPARGSTEGAQQLIDTEIVIAEPKKTGVCRPARYAGRFKRGRRAAHQLYLFAQRVRPFVERPWPRSCGLGRCEAFDDAMLADPPFPAAT